MAHRVRILPHNEPLRASHRRSPLASPPRVNKRGPLVQGAEGTRCTRRPRPRRPHCARAGPPARMRTRGRRSRESGDRRWRGRRAGRPRQRRRLARQSAEPITRRERALVIGCAAVRRADHTPRAGARHRLCGTPPSRSRAASGRSSTPVRQSAEPITRRERALVIARERSAAGTPRVDPPLFRPTSARWLDLAEGRSFWISPGQPRLDLAARRGRCGRALLRAAAVHVRPGRSEASSGATTTPRARRVTPYDDARRTPSLSRAASSARSPPARARVARRPAGAALETAEAVEGEIARSRSTGGAATGGVVVARLSLTTAVPTLIAPPRSGAFSPDRPRHLFCFGATGARLDGPRSVRRRLRTIGLANPTMTPTRRGGKGLRQRAARKRRVPCTHAPFLRWGGGGRAREPQGTARVLVCDGRCVVHRNTRAGSHTGTHTQEHTCDS